MLHLPSPCCFLSVLFRPLPFPFYCCLPRPSCSMVSSLNLFGVSPLGCSGPTSPCSFLPSTGCRGPCATPSSSPPYAATTAAPSIVSGSLLTSSYASLPESLPEQLQQESLPSDSLISSSYSAFLRRRASTSPSRQPSSTSLSASNESCSHNE